MTESTCFDTVRLLQTPDDMKPKRMMNDDPTEERFHFTSKEEATEALPLVLRFCIEQQYRYTRSKGFVIKKVTV